MKMEKESSKNKEKAASKPKIAQQKKPHDKEAPVHYDHKGDA